MTDAIRGIECSLYNNGIEDLLLYIANDPFDFYIESCMRIDDKNMILPKSEGDFRISPHDLKRMAKEDSGARAAKRRPYWERTALPKYETARLNGAVSNYFLKIEQLLSFL